MYRPNYLFDQAKPISPSYWLFSNFLYQTSSLLICLVSPLASGKPQDLYKIITDNDKSSNWTTMDLTPLLLCHYKNLWNECRACACLISKHLHKALRPFVHPDSACCIIASCCKITLKSPTNYSMEIFLTFRRSSEREKGRLSNMWEIYTTVTIFIGSFCWSSDTRMSCLFMVV